MLSTIDNIPIESVFIYSCMARRRFLESQASIDIQYFSQIADVSGFFTYGEFYTNKKQLNFLNETLTLLGLSESNHISQNIINKTDIHFQNITTLQAISNLANAASKEFEELNNNLELKIKKEVEKNIEFEKRLFNSMKMASLGDMIANIAHQWRQPLSVITSTASAMQLNKDLDLLDDDSFKQHIDSIISQAMYLSETVDTFRNFVKEKHELKTFPIQKEIQKALKITEVTFKDNKIELIDNIDYENEISVKLIVGELSQVLINIINNAKDVLIQNNIQDKWIKLDLELNKTDVVIFIEDNGGGIPDEIIDKIFEPYFTTKDDNIGTGIGLYMSYDIIVKHFKGDIKVVNTNHGAKFIIKIPLCYE
jgi:signal transduction histidine kinase